MRRRFILEREDAVSGSSAFLRGAQAAHLAQVLRAQPGQRFELAHGGQVMLGEIAEIQNDWVRFDLIAPVEAASTEGQIGLASALFKFDRFEWMLEKAAELGVRQIQILITRRTEPRLIDAVPKKIGRWRRILAESAEQSRRAEVPALIEPLPFTELLAQAGGTRFLLDETPGGGPLPIGLAQALLLTGPEGGWHPDEAAAAREAGFTPVSLGPRVLRCETAIISALAIAGR